MKNQERDRRETERKIVYWGYQSKGFRYDSSHERYVVPWQMEHDKKK